MHGSVSWCLFGVAAMIVLGPVQGSAEPARIIILRHAEKLDHKSLCDLGEQRAQALARQFLGRDATQSLFAAGEEPAAFLAVSHQRRRGKHADDDEKEAGLIRRTQEAAHDVLTDPRYAGKTVVITWEHNHIAKSKLEKEHPGEQVTLRQLLRLDQIAKVPKTWPDSNYDYFWIVDYTPGNPVPVRFQMVQQAFTAPFDGLPANEWDEPEPKHLDAGCKK